MERTDGSEIHLFKRHIMSKQGKRKSHLKKVVDSPKTEATPIEQPMTEVERKDLEQNIAIGKLYEKLKPTIDDPLKLCITVARIYAAAILLTYRQSTGEVDIKIPQPTGESGDA